MSSTPFVSAHLAATATNILADPKQLEQLVERIYELMREDLRQQQERLSNHSNGKGWL